jgi:hypothetical protein
MLALIAMTMLAKIFKTRGLIRFGMKIICRRIGAAFGTLYGNGNAANVNAHEDGCARVDRSNRQ